MCCCAVRMHLAHEPTKILLCVLVPAQGQDHDSHSDALIKAAVWGR